MELTQPAAERDVARCVSSFAPWFARVRVEWPGPRRLLRNKGSRRRSPELGAGNEGRLDAIDDCILGNS